MLVGVEFREEVIAATMKDDCGVRITSTWKCECGCELRIYFGWGTAITEQFAKVSVMWMVPSHVHVEVDSLDQLDAYIAEHGLPLPLRCFTDRERTEHHARYLMGSGEHSSRGLVMAVQALFPKVAVA